MPRFEVYQQHPPIDTKRKTKAGDAIYMANLLHVITLDAKSANDAMAKAKALPAFKYGTGRLRWPVVEEIVHE